MSLMDMAMSAQVTRRRFLKVLAPAVAAVVGGLGVRSAFQIASSEGRAVHADEGGITGRVVDLVTERPLAGVELTIVPSGPSTTTDHSGYYRLPLPSGTYDIRARAEGYLEVTAAMRRVEASRPAVVDFRLIPASPTAEEDEAIYSRLVVQPQPSQEAGQFSGLSPTSVVSVPSTIRVLLHLTGEVVTMDFEQYLRGVVPSEMPPSWHVEALRAQAVAARSYAAYQVAHPKHANADVCDWVCCQVWQPYYYDRTDAAVADTRGVVATYGGSIISAFFFAHCNAESTRNSEEALNWQTCTVQPWGYIPYCRAKPCGGHQRYNSSCGYYGHGVGMCQWGAKAKAESGKSFRTILNEYYTGISIAGVPQLLEPIDGYLVETGTQVEFRWTAAGDQHWLEIRRSSPDGQVWRDSGWLSATSWTALFGEPGTYYWRVKGKTGTTETAWSETRRLIVADTVYKTMLPLVSRNASS
ncbi:MAG: SpoIID/LytB domain-containing protein [Chloroflexota bacterium]